MPRSPAAPVDPAYYQKAFAKGTSEAELREWVTELASALGWHWRYIRVSLAQNVAGLPDLVLWHSQRQLQIWVELKAEKGKLSKSRLSLRGNLIEGQEETIESLRAAGQVVYIWRPSDWVGGAIERVLKA